MAKKSKKNEVAEIEKSYESIAGKSKQKASSGKGCVAAIIAGSVAIVLIAAAIGILYFFPQLWRPDRIDAAVNIAGADLTGMTREEAVEALTNTVGSYTQNTMTVTAGEHTVELTPELSGASVDIEAAVDAAMLLSKDTVEFDIIPFLNLNEQAIKEALSIIVESTETALIHSTYEVTGTSDITAGTTDMKLVITIGQPGINSDIDLIYEEVLGAYRQNVFSVDYPLQLVEPNAPDLEKAKEEHSLEAVDAVMDMETFEVTAHSFGYTFDLEQAQTAVSGADYGQIIEIPFNVTEPEVYEEELSSMLYRDVLGSYTAYSSSKPGTRDVNLKLSCQKINGKVLYPGDVFDYNKALGERTEAGGWKKADGYSNGDTVSVYGGGICQASSALYYCTLIADVEIVTRINHSYVSSYMPLGMDATVSWGGPDFRFKNTTDYPIRIEATANKGNVTVKLIGTDTKDYYVKMEYEVLEKTPYKTVYKEMTADEAEDYKDGDQMVSGYTGHKVITYKCKYNKETNELISREKEATSTYKRRDRVICKILEPEKPTETTPPATTAPPETTVPETTVPETTVPESTEPETTSPITDGSGGVEEDI